MKNFLRVFGLFTAIFCFASAQATPTLYDITGLAGTESYSDTGAESGELTDTSGVDDDATAFLLFEFAGYKDTTSFGLYDFSSTGSTISVGDMLQVFSGSDDAVDSSTVHFDLAGGTATVGTATANIGPQFGFYIHVGQTGHTYYSHAALNGDGVDHALLFDTSDNSVGSLLGSDIVVAWEDLWGGGDWDYNDMVVGISDVRANVPEPGSLALLGAGLLGLGIMRRRRAAVR